MSADILHNWERKSRERQKHYRRFLLKTSGKTIMRRLPGLHEQAVSNVDCLSCAACCRNYSPRFKTPDIKRMSRHLKMKESVFIETYLRVDEDGDFVVKSAPCPFLGDDNRCSVYDVRPSDCARFPYTDEDVVFKRIPLTLKNATFCPITFYVLEKLCGVPEH